MSTSIATQKVSKSELKAIATKMLAENEKCLKSNFSKTFPYSQFVEIYKSLQKEKFEKETAVRKKTEKINVAKKLKLSVKAIDNAISLLSNINLNDYRTGHSMGYSANIKIANQLTACSVNNESTYAKSCTWKAVHGFYSINISVEMVRQLQNCYYEKIGGVDTFVFRGTEKIKKCLFVQESGSKNNYSVKLIGGYTTCGFHAKTQKECEAWRQKEALRIKTERLTLSEIEKKKAKFVGMTHSIKAGNCEQGTLNFAKRYNLDPKMGYQIGYLMSLENSTYTQRLLSI